jgi:hypothetical protein
MSIKTSPIHLPLDKDDLDKLELFERAEDFFIEAGDGATLKSVNLFRFGTCLWPGRHLLTDNGKSYFISEDMLSVQDCPMADSFNVTSYDSVRDFYTKHNSKLKRFNTSKHALILIFSELEVFVKCTATVHKVYAVEVTVNCNDEIVVLGYIRANGMRKYGKFKTTDLYHYEGVKHDNLIQKVNRYTSRTICKKCIWGASGDKVAQDFKERKERASKNNHRGNKVPNTRKKPSSGRSLVDSKPNRASGRRKQWWSTINGTREENLNHLANLVSKLGLTSPKFENPIQREQLALGLGRVVLDLVHHLSTKNGGKFDARRE